MSRRAAAAAAAVHLERPENELAPGLFLGCPASRPD